VRQEGALTAALLLAASGIVPRLLTDDAVVLDAVASAWWLLALGHLITGVVFALDGVMMGAEDYRYLRDTTVLAALVGGSAAQVVASTGGTLLGLWWCVQTLMLVRFVALVWRLRGPGWLDASAQARTHGGAGASIRASGDAT
jgi:Na+-driven multidrug efflux pump